MIRSGVLRLMAVIALVSSAGLTPSSASAAQALPQHCAVRLVPVETSDRGTVAAELVHLGCFQTFARSIAIGSAGATLLPVTATPEGLTQRTVNTSTTWGGSTLIGTEYTAASYAGSSHSYFASSTCSAGTTWEVADVGASWNNDFESGKGFGGCDTNKKFAWQNFGGDVRTCTPNCATYGALQNDVSSLRWRP